MNDDRQLHVDLPTAPDRAGALTWGQLAIWEVLHWLPPGDTTLTLSTVLPLPAGTTPERLTAALTVLVARHDALRTVFEESGGEPRQTVVGGGRIAVDVHDAPEGAAAETAGKLHRELRGLPFDLARDLPLRAVLVTERDTPAALVLAISHMSVDAWSFRIVREDLETLLAGAELPARGPQPLDRLDYERSDLGRRREERALAHWAEQIRETPAPMLAELPPPSAPHLRWGRIESPALAAAVRLLTGRAGVTGPVAVLGGVTRLLARYTGQDQATVRLIVATRFNARNRRFVGAFNQNALLRVPSVADPFDDHLRRTSLAALTAYQNCEYDPRTVERIVRETAAERGVAAGGYCFFNDISVEPARRPGTEPRAADAPDPRPLRAETVLSVPDMDQVPMGATFFLFLEHIGERAVLQLCADERFLAPRSATEFLGDLEDVLVSAAVAPSAAAG
ncbi:condensation domain-containing protein [Kitasatospora sp. NPDC090308]|uniref:condensation domain-containing protein n=1 Tax=Kitasatospora sp. NPDC090308 TaxID=3364082 RepID=UPI003806B2C5